MSATDLVWFKSSYSGTQGDDCLEVAVGPGAVHVRDSKDVARRPFAVGRAGWVHFVRFAARHGGDL